MLDVEQVGPGIFRLPEFVPQVHCDQIVRWIGSSAHWVRAEAGKYSRNELVHSQVDLKLRDVEVSRDRLPPEMEEYLRVSEAEDFARDRYGINNLRASRYVLSKYRPGCHIRPHSDTTFSSTSRVVTCVQYFNEDFSGGDIYFPQFRKSVMPLKGSLLMFYSEYLHGVSEITAGTRFCSVSFLEHVVCEDRAT